MGGSSGDSNSVLPAPGLFLRSQSLPNSSAQDASDGLLDSSGGFGFGSGGSRLGVSVSSSVSDAAVSSHFSAALSPHSTRSSPGLPPNHPPHSNAMPMPMSGLGALPPPRLNNNNYAPQQQQQQQQQQHHHPAHRRDLSGSMPGAHFNRGMGSHTPLTISSSSSASVGGHSGGGSGSSGSGNSAEPHGFTHSSSSLPNSFHPRSYQPQQPQQSHPSYRQSFHPSQPHSHSHSHSHSSHVAPSSSSVHSYLSGQLSAHAFLLPTQSPPAHARGAAPSDSGRVSHSRSDSGHSSTDEHAHLSQPAYTHGVITAGHPQLQHPHHLPQSRFPSSSDDYDEIEAQYLEPIDDDAVASPHGQQQQQPASPSAARSSIYRGGGGGPLGSASTPTSPSTAHKSRGLGTSYANHDWDNRAQRDNRTQQD